VKGKYGLMSEECGLDRAVPQRDRDLDVFPMKYDMAIVRPDAEGVVLWNQLDGTVEPVREKAKAETKAKTKAKAKRKAKRKARA
jgi:hypothetical protein